jgi:Tol biopolymer transport system component
MWITGSILLVIAFAVLSRVVFTNSEVTSNLRPLVSLPGAKGSPTLSPDGQFVAFFWSGPLEKPEPGIYVKPVDGEALRYLTSGFNPAWSPDGKEIAFVRSGNEGGIFVVPARGGTERKLSDSGTDVRWLSDSQTLIIRDKDPEAGERFALFSLSPKTSQKKCLTHAPTGIGDAEFAVSPDGSTLAFIRYGIPGVGDLYRMAVTGGTPVRMTAWNADFDGLAWTPDSREIIYSVGEPAGPRLWRISADAASPGRGARLIESTGNAQAPAIVRSPIGRRFRLAYQTTREDICLRLIDLAARRAGQPLDSGLAFQRSSRAETQGQVSPDGKQLAFISNRSGPREIWLSSLDGSSLRKLTNLQTVGINFPAWSPDGKQIAFISSAGDLGRKAVFVIDVNSGLPKQRTDPMTVGPPSWSRDGRWIYFMSDRSGAYRIWKMTPDGEQVTAVTQSGGFEAQESPDGKYLYYSEQPPRGVSGLDAPVRLMRVPVEGGEGVAVLPQIWTLHWAATDKGIYYLSPGPPKAVYLYSYPDGETHLIGSLADQPTALAGTMAASRDGRWLTMSRVEREDTDLMLIDNFH